MRRSWSVAPGLALAATVLSVACSSRPPQLGDYDAEWQARLEEMGKAYETLDVNRIGAYYAPETFAHAFELPYEWSTGVGEKKERAGSMLANVGSMTFAMTDDVQTWTRRGKVWTLRGVRISNRLKDGRTVDFDGRHSAIWEKRDGTWVMIHEHYWGAHRETALAPPPAAPEKPGEH